MQKSELIQQMLEAKKSYRSIARELKVGQGKIADVARKIKLERSTLPRFGRRGLIVFFLIVGGILIAYFIYKRKRQNSKSTSGETQVKES
ncbi:MAG: hypothetical protein ABSB32_08945 [Thermodesulfobacteriota bacterium]